MRLDRAGRAEAVAHHRLRRRDRELVGVVAEDVLDRLRLGGVAERRRRAVRVDVADALRLDAGALERRAHHLGDADRLRLGRGHVVARRSTCRSRAPRRRSSRRDRCAASSSSRTSTPAPSPMTKPARVASNGREARGGCSSSAARPRIAQKPARISGCMQASVAAGEHRVGVAAPDDLGSLADRVRAGRAGGDGRVVRAPAGRARSRAGRSPSRRARSAGSTARPGRAALAAGPRAAP